jgi:hypothetical protein
MRTWLLCVLCVSAVVGNTACGEKSQPCHSYRSTCMASCLDGSTPQFVGETEACFGSAPEGQDPRDWFCDPNAVGGSAAAQHCPSQATSGGTSDCTSCGAWTVGPECACPSFGDGHF